MKEKDTCAVLIKHIHTELEKNANNALRQDDLTMSQIAVLMELSQAEGKQMELKQVERALHVAQSTAAGIVRRLEQKGFVESFGDSEDKRIKVIRITEIGKQCCSAADQRMAEAERNLLSGLSETERGIFLSLLEKVYHSLQ